VVGTGGAVRPLTLCLAAQGSRWTDPTIAPAFDGLKYFRLSQGSRLATAPCFGRHSLDPATRGSTGVSGHRISAVLHSQGVTGRWIAPSTEMSSITIYRADLLERRAASHLMP
jgi:hypothetical protein